MPAIGDDHRSSMHMDEHASHSEPYLPRWRASDCDLNDDFLSDGEVDSSQRFKKRRAGESPFAEMATRLGTRFPSFSRKWKERKASNPTSAVLDAQRQGAPSRAASSRSSSLSDSIRRGMGGEKSEPQMPPTPTKSVFDEESEERLNGSGGIDMEKANQCSSEEEEGLSSTPLLPPLMNDAAASRHVSLQSPLQSPSIADCGDGFAGNINPVDTLMGQQSFGVPSPPLSTKPSISSFHRVNMSRPGQLLAGAEIPPILIADANDEWANRLGHANFTIVPEPYLPIVFDVSACRELRANWDLARCNYTKHLVRTGEHYGATSKTYKLTEEKWAQIDFDWRKNNDTTIQNTVDNGGDALSTLRHYTLGDPTQSNIMTKIPSLNDLRSGGKFPQLGDEDIIGPMEVVAAQLKRVPSKKAKILKFFAEKFPTGLGRALA